MPVLLAVGLGYRDDTAEEEEEEDLTAAPLLPSQPQKNSMSKKLSFTGVDHLRLACTSFNYHIGPTCILLKSTSGTLELQVLCGNEACNPRSAALYAETQPTVGE